MAASIWKKISESSQKVGWRIITEKVFLNPDGEEQSFTTFYKTGGESIAVIALTKENQVIIARQFRPGPELVFDELPGGFAEEGEELQSAALREFSEETGYTTDAPLEYLGEVYRDAYSNNRNRYYLARDCYQVSKQQLDHGEYVEITMISIDNLIANAKDAKMSDAAAVLLAYETLRKIEHEAA